MQPHVAAKFVGLIVAIVAVGGLVVLVGSRLFGAAAGPDAELITRLKASERTGLRLEIPGSPVPLVAGTHRYDRINAWVDQESGTLVIDCTLELTGKLGDVEVGSFTSEKLVFRQRGNDWEPEEGYAPSLTAVLTALQSRRTALETLNRRRLGELLGPAAAGGDEQLRAARRDEQELSFLETVRNRSYKVKAWYIRAEPDQAIVTEDFRVTGDLPQQPVDSVASRRLTLKRSGREFFFWPGIM